MVDSPGHTVAGIPLLETKLYIPKWRPGLVSRPRLIERMHQGIECKLTLVSAPAGFGHSCTRPPPDKFHANYPY